MSIMSYYLEKHSSHLIEKQRVERALAQQKEIDEFRTKFSSWLMNEYGLTLEEVNDSDGPKFIEEFNNQQTKS